LRKEPQPAKEAHPGRRPAWAHCPEGRPPVPSALEPVQELAGPRRPKGSTPERHPGHGQGPRAGWRGRVRRPQPAGIAPANL